MRVVVVGATGNVGTSVVRALAHDDTVDHVVGVARRDPGWQLPGVSWRTLDVTRDDLEPVLRDVDVLVHLAWLVQPSHDVDRLWDVNVVGTDRLLDAARTAGVPTVVYASSVGVYSPGPDGGERVDESWPTHGIPTSAYSSAKAYTERLLDAFEASAPSTRVVRLRPALIFKVEAAARIRRLFIGEAVPRRLFGPGVLPLVPRIPGVRFQAVHTTDVAEAYRLAAIRPVSGAFNLAAEPVLSLRDVAEVLEARSVPVPAWVARGAVGATWRARLQPIDAGWFDLALKSPLMDVTRARRELGWQPRHDARSALRELLAGIREHGAGPTPPLAAQGETSDDGGAVLPGTS